MAYDDFYNGIGYGPRFDFNICKTTVMEYTGTGATGWQPVGNSDFSSGMSSYDSLYVSNGTPYVAYIDRTYGGVAKLMEYTGGSWQMVGGSVDSIGTANGETIFCFPGTSLFVYNGTPYVATVMEYAGATTASSAEPAIQVNINGPPCKWMCRQRSSTGARWCRCGRSSRPWGPRFSGILPTGASSIVGF